MEFHTDHYFHIGSLHYQAGKPCQDYALSGASARAACAIVSDGCSTGRHTDVGSRIQALSLLGAVKSASPIYWGEREAMKKAVREERSRILSESERLLGLERSDMLATLAYAYLSHDGGFVRIEGDGAVAWKFRDGRIATTLYEWDGNMPYYPVYTNLDLVEFVKAHGGDLEAERLTRTFVSFDAAGSQSGEEISRLTLREGITGITEEVTVEELKELDVMALYSDGVSQIGDAKWFEVVRSLVSYKSLEGEFAKRRIIRALRDYERSGKKLADDISTAAIRVIHHEEEANVARDS